MRTIMITEDNGNYSVSYDFESYGATTKYAEFEPAFFGLLSLVRDMRCDPRDYGKSPPQANSIAA